MEESVDQLVYSSPLPPPYKVEEEPVDDINVNIPGQIKISESGELLKSHITFAGFAGDIIVGFNSFLGDELGKLLYSRPLRFVDGSLVYFHSPTISPPMISTSVNKEPLYPITARQRNLTYSSEIYARMIRTTAKGEIMEEYPNPVFLGKMPIMLGSAYCHLAGKSDEEKLELGECPHDPFGYFIIKGVEKVIFIQEKLRTNRYIIFHDKTKGAICRFTSQTPRGTSLIILEEGVSEPAKKNKKPKKNKTIRLFLYFLGKDKTIPVFLAFRILLLGLGVDEDRMVETYMSFVLYFVPEKYVGKVNALLQASYFQEASIGDHFSYLRSFIPHDNSDSELVRSLTEELFPQMNQPAEKLYMLALMTAQYAMYLAGLRGLDNRDSVSNKRFETAGTSLLQLFNTLFKETIKETELEINKPRSAAGAFYGDYFEAVNRNFKHAKITETLVSTFTQGSWGVKNVYAKDNITSILSRESLLDVYAQITKINTPTRRQAKQPHIRMSQLTQLGFIGFFETPEGRAVGLIKHKAVTCQTSTNEEDETILFAIRDMIHFEKREETPNGCIVNGRFIGWCMGEIVRKFVVKLRRERAIALYTSVVLYKDNVLYIYTDSSRFVRPLLIVENGEAIYETKNLRDSTFEELLNNGAVEYVDSMEQETLYIAQSLNTLREHRASINNSRIKLQEVKEIVKNLESVTENYREYISDYRIIEGVEVTINKANLSDEEAYEEYQNTLIKARENLETIQYKLNELIRKGDYTHVELDPNALFSISETLLPLPDHNMGPRNMYTCSMMKQGVGIPHTSHAIRFDSEMKMLASPAPPIFATQTTEWIGLNNLPSGATVIVAIMPYLGYNQEDAFIFNKASIERGLFGYIIYISYTTVENKKEGDIVSTIMYPTGEEGKKDIYKALDENGIARVGASVKAGDVLVSKTRRNMKNGYISVENTRVAISASGYVERVLVDKNEDGLKIVKIKIREVRLSNDPIIGDKFSSRYAQKGTIGLIVNQEDMPFTINGLVPDLIINPLSIPSRMTIGKLIEITASKVGALRGERINATAFNDFNVEEYENMLVQLGYERHGMEKLINGLTGEQIEAPIFIGPCYYQLLRHLVKNKMQIRSTNLYHGVSRQPVGGRQRGGAIRIGKMEANALLSHGASSTLQESFMDRSDAYETLVCLKCGSIAISSPQFDKPLCNSCEKGTNDFGRVRIPFASVWLSHLLSGAGINVRYKFAKKESL